MINVLKILTFSLRYSPDFAPMDFRVFINVKAELRDRKIKNTSEFTHATRNFDQD